MPLVTAVAIAAGLAVSVLAWQGTGGGRPRGVVVTFTVVSDQEVSAQVEVDAGGRDATCVLRAQRRDALEVGRTEIVVPGDRARHTFRLVTSERAAAVEIGSCR